MSQTSFFRQLFSLWEQPTSAFFETLLRSPLFLSASGAGLNSFLLMKKFSDTLQRSMIVAMGLPTRDDQLKTLHLLHQIEGRLDDLQFQLEGQEPGTATAAEQP